jgi:release factor glutamine methyltransferase
MSRSDDTGTRHGTRLALTTVSDLYRQGVEALSAAGIENARRETTWILEAALQLPPITIHTSDRPVAAGREARARRLFARRAARQPLQYLLGTQEFCGLEFEVDPHVLIPRPETELLVSEVLAHVGAVRPPVIADIGTGSGCIAIALGRALPAARIYAVDQSPAAMTLAARNALRLGAGDRVTFRHGDLLQPLRELGLQGRVTIVVSNPPYIPDGDLPGLMPEVSTFEPRLALAGGRDGLAIHRRLLHESPELLTEDGLLALEIGQGQAGRLLALAEAHGGYRHLHTVRDQAGIERVMCLRKR